MNDQKEQSKSLLISIPKQSILSILFPNLSGLNVIVTSKIKDPQFVNGNIICEQLILNGLIMMFEEHPHCCIQYKAIDIISKKNNNQLLIEVFDRQGYVATLDTLINEVLPKIWQLGWETVQIWISQLWAHLSLCLESLESHFLDVNEYILCFLTFCLTKSNDRNQIKAMIRISSIQSTQNNKPNDSLRKFCANQFEAMVIKSSSKSKTGKKNESLTKEFIKLLLQSCPKPDQNYDFQVAFAEYEQFENCSQIEAISYFTAFYLNHFRHMNQYLFELEKSKSGKLKLEELEFEWVGIPIPRKETSKMLLQKIQSILKEAHLFEFWNIFKNETIVLRSHKLQLIRFINPTKFYNYAHFEQIVKKLGSYSIRTPIKMFISKQQKFNLHYSLNNLKQMMHFPVRGRYCRHIEFYDLKKVYQAILKQEGSHELNQGFSCFVCEQWTNISDLLYVEEGKVLIEALFYYEFVDDECNREDWEITMEINHQKETVSFHSKLKKYMSNQFTLSGVYPTLLDPKCRFRRQMRFFRPWIQNEKSEEDELFEILEQAWDNRNRQELNHIENPTLRLYSKGQ